MVKFSLALSSDNTIKKIVETIKIAECKGYDIGFVTDEGLCRNVYAILAICALNTKKIKLGTGVTNPYTRNPGLTAAAIATIDNISNGRALLGLGVGSLSSLESFGIKQRNPITTLREAVMVIRRLLQGHTVTSVWEGFELCDAKLDFSSERVVPIYIAGRGPKILRLAGEIGDGVIAGAGLVSKSGVKYALDNILKGMREAGRQLEDIDIIYWAFCSIASDGEIAKDSTRQIIARIVCNVPTNTLIKTGMKEEEITKIKRQRDQVKEMSKEDLRSLVTNDLVDQFSIAGAPEDCIKKMEDLIHAGVNHIAILPIENTEKGIEDIAKQFSNSVIKNI